MSAQAAIAKLDEYATELNERSNELTATQRAIDKVQPAYDDFLRDFHVDMYERCLRDGTKLPATALRDLLALKEMPTEFRQEFDALVRKRERLRKRISDLKASVEAQRSVLSAEKVAIEAGGA